MAEEKKLFLLDAFALIYRAYFGFGKNHRYNSKGLNTSAMLGFTNMLKTDRTIQPNRLCIFIWERNDPRLRRASTRQMDQFYGL